MRKIDFRDPVVWLVLALGVPFIIALGVLTWGYSATDRNVSVPDPSASPILGIAPDGRPLLLAPTQAPASPTPPRQPGYFRVEGVVVDQLGMPIENACIEIGPNGCREHSPRTDGRGVYYMDFPKADVEYDLHFTREGYQPQVKRIKPTADLVLNLVLAR